MIRPGMVEWGFQVHHVTPAYKAKLSTNMQLASPNTQLSAYWHEAVALIPNNPCSITSYRPRPGDLLSLHATPKTGNLLIYQEDILDHSLLVKISLRVDV